MLLLLGLVLPLCLDTFAVAAALGMTGLTGRERLRFGLLFAAFEGGMPLVGLVVGAGLGRLVGGLADWVAIGVLVAVGGLMLLGDDEAEERRVRRLRGASGLALVGLGVSISLDELAIGFTLGLTNVPVAAAVVLIAAQAFLVSQVGFQVGRRVGERFREWAERLAGVVLIGLGAWLLVAKIFGLGL
ncbi:MAG: manganese efflux pump [Chloroflexota bacterium]